MADTTEVAVLGGGPAGATVALLLARWGHSVQLFTKPETGHPLAVSLPPSCGKLFDAIGVTGAISRAEFVRSTGNTVWWGSGDARVESFANDALGWQLEVGRLSDVLLDCALAAGMKRGQTRRGGSSDPPAERPASFLIDCTGRAGIIARARQLREYDPGVHTVALVAEWRRDGPWPVPDDTHTLIESYDDGWMWSVPAEPGVRHIAAMVDPLRSALAKGEPAKEIYLAEIAKTRTFSRLIDGASLHEGPRGWDASQYRAREYAGDGWLLAGDAGSFIDPLSSAGVKKALASGWLAAVVAHTCLRTPAMRSHALDFFSAREREIERHLSRESRRFLAGAAASHHRPFWEDRSDDALADDEERTAIQLALARLKGRDALRVALSPEVAIAMRPCIRGHEIVLEPHLVASDDPRGVRYINGIDVVTLTQLAPSAPSVPALFEACIKRLGPMPLHDFLFALATAVARGWLVAE